MLTSSPKGTSNIQDAVYRQRQITPRQIRASIDMRVPNSNMKCSRCVQAPRVEDFAYALRECIVFSKLGSKSGYHQLAIDEASVKVSKFSTPWEEYLVI